jgi:hypothetical protein
MKNIPSFETFINEGYIDLINEKLDLSEDLLKIKNAEELNSACANKYLIIHSKHSITDMKKRGGDYPQMWIISGIGTGRISICSKGYMVHGGDINAFADKNYTAYSINFTIDQVFEFFMFNRNRGNRIYTVDELPIHKEMKAIQDEWRKNMNEITSLLGPSVQVGNIDVTASVYAVQSEGDSHGVEILEFTAEGKSYTFYWNVYSYDPSIKSGRRTARAGYNRNQSIHRIGKKEATQIYKLAENCVKIVDDARNILKEYYKKENIKPN